MARVIAIAGDGGKMFMRNRKMGALLHNLATYGLVVGPEVFCGNAAIQGCWSRGPYSQKARRDFSDWVAQPKSSPPLKSTRRAFLHFRGRFSHPQNSMVIPRPTALQAKLLDRSMRRRKGGKGNARVVLSQQTKQNTTRQSYFGSLGQSALSAFGKAS